MSNAKLTCEIVMPSSSLNLGGTTQGIPSVIQQEKGWETKWPDPTAGAFPPLHAPSTSPFCHIITSRLCSGEHHIPSPTGKLTSSQGSLSPDLSAWPPKHPTPSAQLYHKCCCPQASLLGLPRHEAIFTSFSSQACRPQGEAASAFLQQLSTPPPHPHLEHLLCNSGKFRCLGPHPWCWNFFSQFHHGLGPL